MKHNCPICRKPVDSDDRSPTFRFLQRPLPAAGPGKLGRRKSTSCPEPLFNEEGEAKRLEPDKHRKM